MAKTVPRAARPQVALGADRSLGLELGKRGAPHPPAEPPLTRSVCPDAFQTYNKKGASRRKEYLKDHQNGSVAAVNGHTNSFSSLENNVKPRKQRKD